MEKKCPQDCLDKIAYVQAIVLSAGVLATCFFCRPQYIPYDFCLNIGICVITRDLAVLFIFLMANTPAVILIKKIRCRSCLGSPKKTGDDCGFPHVIG
jgi:hypothetical protein